MMTQALPVAFKDVLRGPYNSVRHAFWYCLDRFDHILGRADPLRPPRTLLTVGGGDFFEIGQRNIDLIRQHCGLKPTDRILEIGCGVGRNSIPLMGWLSGQYHGFDIYKPYIDWAETRITSREPRIMFHHQDIYNSQYNKNGKVEASEYRFNLAGEFDVVFLTSVFTHMLPKDIHHYLGEISRMLKPGGRLYATFFLLNSESRALIAQGKSTIPMDFEFEKGCYVKNLQHPEFAIAYPVELIGGWLAENDLVVEKQLYGAWSGRSDYTDYQDIVVARRAMS